MTPTPTQSSTPAQSTSAAPSAPSYASAAGSSKKAPSNNPAPASSASSTAHHQHAKSASISANGRLPITPALPTVQGLNGAFTSGEHSRKNSVTIGANGSSSSAAYPGNVKPASSNSHSQKSSIKFGNFDSPVMSHNTPSKQAGSGSASQQQQQQLPPSHSSPAPPSPIPIAGAIPISSGGRPPSVVQTGMTFGSLGNEDWISPQQPNGLPPGNYRGNSGHGNRGGMPFQPGSHSHGPNQNRPPMHATSSPQPGRSPHLSNSAMSTPNMPPASLAQPMPAQTPPHQYYSQPSMGGGMQPAQAETAT
ncbi:Eukaryotic translation initiation factor 4 gamma [Ceratocystis lukuohia]|uniref:Eukaryotic translation initiation factor 4 gamma n=1 Tax=Ceratocystis lukuohia TaxID=2019550 RepID=A0ABR4MQN3_9PEZI